MQWQLFQARFPGKQTKRWRCVCRRLIRDLLWVAYLGEVKGAGWVLEKLSCDVITAKTSGDSIEGSPFLYPSVD